MGHPNIFKWLYLLVCFLYSRWIHMFFEYFLATELNFQSSLIAHKVKKHHIQLDRHPAYTAIHYTEWWTMDCCRTRKTQFTPLKVNKHKKTLTHSCKWPMQKANLFCSLLSNPRRAPGGALKGCLALILYSSLLYPFILYFTPPSITPVLP